MNCLQLTWAGEKLELFAEKAIYWGRTKTLIITDPHFGKASAFRHAGIPVPEQVTDADLSRLEKLLQTTNAKRLLILGDLLHSASGRSESTMGKVEDWRRRHANVRIDLAIGNHDQHCGELPESWGIHCADELSETPFLFSHEPQKSPDLFNLHGHIHPAISCPAVGGSMRLPCFHFGEKHAVVPAFGSFTGTHLIRPVETDRVFVTNEGEIMELPATLLRG